MIDSDGILEAFGEQPARTSSDLYKEKLAEAQAGNPGIRPVDLQKPQKLRYTHDAMIDLILRDPSVSQNYIAEVFGYSAPSISRIISSDAFQARLHERRKELIDPGILASVDERFTQMAMKSLQVIQEKLDTTPNLDMAFKALDVSAKALGYGARTPQVAINQSFVVSLPEKAASQDAWLAKYGRVPAEVVDATQKEAQSGA